mmetsp:Transcript_36228/g.35158  ORF Transcript_36228/g.35158 Transcript_36228/m.35158 type:complete len:202 (+) Transcript_36228:198-803(+)|eukprot:CAMPEP_0170545768 /NCGR_PEP_ID=MMETSP0211-20121228/4143_1 /TAXON_ID=311385 /ORGANISM="Pseudokeronopsis sp., Strain OXSARD2" /LENGTH=201 /DNA_ID=CAMNT_0010849859 /DNA_START=161 /DNA_END=766 /DNA_ORIENTATION=+
MASNHIYLETKNSNADVQKFVKELNEQIKKSTPSDLSSLLQFVCDKYKYYFMETAGEDNKFEDNKGEDKDSNGEYDEWEDQENEEYKEVINMIQEGEAEDRYFQMIGEQDNQANNDGSPSIKSYDKIALANKRDVDTFKNQVYSISQNNKLKDDALIKGYKLLMSSPEFENIITIEYDEKNFSNWTVIFDLKKKNFPHRLA